MNLQQLDYISAVAESRSFINAAEMCNVTQSTLSTMISRFEAEMGVKIFDRSTKPVSITREGNLLLDQIRQIVKNTADLKESIKNIKGEIGGKLSVGVIPTVAPFLLPQFLNEFVRDFPSLEIEVSEMTTSNIINQLLSRQLDIGIIATGIDNDKLEEHPLYTESFVVFDYFTNKLPEFIRPDQIKYERMWLLEEGHCLRTQAEKICNLESAVIHENRTFDFRAGSIDSLLRFVKRSRGITLLPYLSTLDLDEKDKSRIIRFTDPVPGRTIGLIVHKHFVKKKVRHLLEDYIVKSMRPLLKKDQPIASSIEPL